MANVEPDFENLISELLERFDEHLASADDIHTPRIEALAPSGLTSTKTVVETSGPESGSQQIPTWDLARFERMQACLKLLEWDRRVRLRADSARESSSQPPSASESLSESQSASQIDHRFIGRFRILRQLGAGGFGMVFLAEDPLLKRLVAVKVPRPETLATRHLQQRFIEESQVAARLAHPHLVSIYDAGELGPISYQVTAYCAGGNLAAWLRSQSTSGCFDKTRSTSQKQLPIYVAVELTKRLAEGVQYAHEHGILHRDIKPSNILLQPIGVGRNDQPSSLDSIEPKDLCSLFQPMIADFGLAKLIGNAAECVSTGSSDKPAQQTTLAGTPQYMAPEQIDSRCGQVSAATDIYGLGAVLYEVLVGQPLYPQLAIEQLKKSIVEQTYEPLHVFRSDIPKDLEAICLKCLAKSATDRYPSASALVEDLRAFQRGQPVSARPLRLPERLYKWSRRRPALAGLVMTCGMLLGVVIGLSTWHMWQLNQLNQRLVRTIAEREKQAKTAQNLERLAEENALRAKDEAQVALQQSRRSDELAWVAEQREYAANLRQASDLLETKTKGGLSSLLTDLQGKRINHIKNDQPSFEWQYLWNQSAGLREFRGLENSIIGCKLARDSKALIAIDTTGRVNYWNVADASLQSSWQYRSRLSEVKINSDGSLAVAIADVGPGQREIAVLDLRYKKILKTRNVPVDDAVVHAITSDAKLVFLGGIGPKVSVWNTETDLFTAESVKELVSSELIEVGTLAISPNDGMLAIGIHTNPGDDAKHELWLAKPFHIDSRKLLSGNLQEEKSQLECWQVVRQMHPGLDWVLAFSADGERLALECVKQNSVDVWDISTKRLLRTFSSDKEWIGGLEFDAHGTSLYTCGIDSVTLESKSTDNLQAQKSNLTNRCIFQLDLSDGSVVPSNNRSEQDIHRIVRSDLGDTLLVGDGGGRVVLWKPSPVASYREWSAHDGRECWGIAFSPDSRSLYSVGDDHTLRCWNLLTGEQTAASRQHTSLVSCVSVSPNGQWIATGSYDNNVIVWRSSDLEPQSSLLGHNNALKAVAFSKDSQRLASGGRDHQVRFWNVNDGTCSRTAELGEGTVRALAFVGNGDVISADSSGRIVQISESGQQVELAQESEEIHCIGFGPSGSRWLRPDADRLPLSQSILKVAEQDELLLLGCKYGRLRLRQLPSAENWFTSQLSTPDIRSVAFSPNGRTFAVATEDCTIQLWNTGSLSRMIAFENLPAVPHQIAFSPDGQTLAAALHNGFIRLWSTTPTD